MKKLLQVLILLFVFAPAAFSAEPVIVVTAPSNAQLQMSISSPVPLEGGARPDVAAEISDVLHFDMTLAGPFSVMAGEGVPGAGGGIRPGEFDFKPWEAAGAKFLVKSGYTVNAGKVTVEFRLYDVLLEKQLAAKRLSGSMSDLRRMAHTFSNEIMKAVTGEAGPFTGKVAFVSTRSGSKEIYLMDYDGHAVQRLTNNGSINLTPDFSPNGREIIYTSYKKRNPDLYRRELFSGAEARISARPGINVTGSYSPAGDRIALALSKDGNSQIYLIAKDGRQLARLTKNSAIDVSPAWSPDGGHIVFVSDRLGKPQIFIMNADGSGVHRLTTAGAYNVSPRWSPKGDRIVYARQHGGGFQIYAINPDGSGDAQLTTEGSNEHPHWSPDGRFIVFDSNRGGRQGIWVMRADGTGQTKVSRDHAADSNPAWSPRW